jgi:type VI secretion system secreted protein VgrG
VQAASNLDLVALRHAQVSAGKRMLFHALESIGLFADRLGMKLIAASGDISIQAQDGLMELIAAKVLRLMCVGGPIELDSAEGIILRSGGAFLELKHGKITAGAPIAWLGEFGSASWSGPASQPARTRTFGKSNAPMDERFVLVNPVGQPAKKRRYRITHEDGRVTEGVSDDQGRTELSTGEVMKAMTLEVFGPEEA